MNLHQRLSQPHCLLVALMACLPAGLVHAGTCKTSGPSVRYEAPPISKAPPANCAAKYGLDTSDQSDKSKTAYVNPNSSGGCDLGLEMPGLPKFGFKFDPRINACQILKKITGDMMESANDKIQTAVDETLGDGVNISGNAQDILEDKATSLIKK